MIGIKLHKFKTKKYIKHVKNIFEKLETIIHKKKIHCQHLIMIKARKYIIDN